MTGKLGPLPQWALERPATTAGLAAATTERWVASTLDAPECVPMGYGMGKLEVIEHDGDGGLRFEERPFVVMQDQAYVDLGVVKGPLAGR